MAGGAGADTDIKSLVSTPAHALDQHMRRGKKMMSFEAPGGTDTVMIGDEATLAQTITCADDLEDEHALQ